MGELPTGSGDDERFAHELSSAIAVARMAMRIEREEAGWLLDAIKRGRLAVLAGLVVLSSGAEAQYSCEQVRGYVGLVGRAQATANAEAAGATKQQLRAARGCLATTRRRK